MKKYRFGITLLLVIFTLTLASCGKPSYNVDFYIDNEVYHTVTTTGKEAVVLPVEPVKNGYAFEGWFTDENQWENEFTANSLLTDGLTGNTAVYAKWSIVNYNLDYVLNGGENNSLNPTKYTVLDNIEFENPSRLGHTFEGWFENSNLTIELENIEVGNTGNKTLYAKWSVNKYTIGFEVNGGSNVDAIEQDFNSQITPPTAPLKDGYTFVGWFTDNSAMETEYEFLTMPLNGIVLYAKWAANNYKVQYSENTGNGNMDQQDFVYDISQNLHKNLFEKIGYTFTGWNTKANGSGENYQDEALISNLASDKNALVILYAQWQANQYIANYNYNGADAGNVETSKTITYDMPYSTLPAPTKTGHTFKGWFEDNNTFENEIKANTIVKTANNHTLHAKWEINQYSIEFISNGGNEIAMITQDYNSQVEQPLNPGRAGYTFEGWFEDDGFFINKYIFETMPAKHVTLYAKWEVIVYYIIYNLNGGVAIENPIEYTVESPTFLLTNPTKEGFDFDGWTGTNLVEPNKNVAVEQGNVGNKEYIANWIPSQNTAYQVLHYKQNILDNEYTLFDTQNLTGTTNETITAVINEYVGFEYNADNSIYSGMIAPNGSLVLKMYYDREIYTITFKNESVQYGAQQQIKFGGNATAPILNPEKQNTQQFTYIFKKWAPDVNQAIVDHTTFNAQYLEITNQYTYTFYNENEIEVLKQLTIDYGKEILAPEEPTKERTQQFSYEFLGWNKEIPEFITEDISFIAQFSENLNYYTVIFKDYDESIIQVNENDFQNIAYGSGADAPANPQRLGYTFQKWDASFEEILDDTIIFAVYVINQYSITFISNGGSEIAKITQDYNSQVAQPLNPTKTGYKFDDWYTDNTDFENKFIFDKMPANNETLFAKWLPIKYIIIFDANTGTGEKMPDQEFTYDVQTLLPISLYEKEGYYFNRWATQANGNGHNFIQGNALNRNLTDIDGDIVTLYATWTSNSYTVIFNANTGTGNMANQGFRYDSPRALTANAFEKIGYEFSGWCDENGNSYLDKQTINNLTTTHKAMINLYAQWTAIEYDINYHLNSGTNNVNNPNIYTIESANIILQDPSKTGYEFIGWFDAEVEGNKIEEIASGSTGNKTLYAQWQASNYTVSFDYQGADAGNSESSKTITYDSAYNILPAPIKIGHTFKGWFDELNYENEIQASTIVIKANNHTLYAKWEINQYSITFNSNGGSEIAKITQDYNSQVAQPLNPNKTGYTFVGWFEDNNIFTNEYVFSIISAKDITLYAKWNLVIYDITYALNDGANNANNPETYTIESTLISLLDANKLGHTFIGWFDAEVGGNKIEEIVNGSTGNKTLYAQWELIEYKIKYSLTEGLPNSNPTTRTIETETFELVPLSGREGYNFIGWYTGRTTGVKVTEVVKGSAQYFNESNILSLYARWEEI